jgi:hypothetical protein
MRDPALIIDVFGFANQIIFIVRSLYDLFCFKYRGVFLSDFQRSGCRTLHQIIA